ncbi:MAG: pathogenesis-related family 1 protein [Reichenbachiella sp.]|uniref:pathogenesis-related family 1 protein n=1 Tax=Reichenbachiella sp. TaxID=2184521 RepID=UPI003264BB99
MKKQFLLMTLIGLVIGASCGSDDNDDGTDETAGLEPSVVTELLDNHNKYRSDVGIANLTWSTELETSAQAWADELASNCDFQHSGSEFGENIWLGTSGAFEPTQVVESWGSEIANYDYDNNSCTDGEVCGHYTQIVWENTTEVGCGVATCDGLDIWVCQYNPPGNFVGQKPY